MDSIIQKNEQELQSFYLPFFQNTNEYEAFINMVYAMDWDEKIPRQMINQIRRFVTLSQRIEEIYPPRDGFRIMFLKMCMESLYFLDKGIGKKAFYKKFAKCFKEDAIKYILSNFRIIGCYYKDNNSFEKNYDCLTIGDVLNIIKYIRDQVVHDGVFWNFQMFAKDKDSQWLTSIETSKKIIDSVTDYSEDEILNYHFETTLQFDKFIYFFTEACINYVNNYIDERRGTTILA